MVALAVSAAVHACLFWLLAKQSAREPAPRPKRDVVELTFISDPPDESERLPEEAPEAPTPSKEPRPAAPRAEASPPPEEPRVPPPPVPEPEPEPIPQAEPKLPREPAPLPESAPLPEPAPRPEPETEAVPPTQEPARPHVPPAEAKPEPPQLQPASPGKAGESAPPADAPLAGPNQGSADPGVALAEPGGQRPFLLPRDHFQVGAGAGSAQPGTTSTPESHAAAEGERREEDRKRVQGRVDKELRESAGAHRVATGTMDPYYSALQNELTAQLAEVPEALGKPQLPRVALDNYLGQLGAHGRTGQAWDPTLSEMMP